MTKKRRENAWKLMQIFGLSDNEIGKLFNTYQQAINRRRLKSLKLLKDYFAKEGIKWDDM